MAPGLAMVDQEVPPSELVSMLPLLNSVARSLPSAASAPGEAATADPIGAGVVQEAPPLAVAASGENVRFWLGSTARVSELAPLADATIPALIATPGGVTSFQSAEFPVREKTCQNTGLAAIGTIAQLSAPAAIDVAIGSVTAAADAAAAAEDDAEVPQAATAPAAASASPAAAARVTLTLRFA